MVFNKKDLVDPSLAALHCRLHQGVAIAAVDDATLPPLINRLEAKVEQLLSRRETARPETEPEFQDGRGVIFSSSRMGLCLTGKLGRIHKAQASPPSSERRALSKATSIR
jgi:hypothetical protein